MRNRKPRIVDWNWIPSPYLQDRFNALQRRGNLDFTAWFSAPTSPERSWTIDESKWQFPYRYLPKLGPDRWRVVLPTPLINWSAPDLLISPYAELSCLLTAVLGRLRGARIAFWAEATFDSRGWVRRRAWKEALKRRIFPAADGIITIGRDGRRFSKKYGAVDGRIHCVRHSIDVEHFRQGRKHALMHREEIRTELGIKGVAYLYVGRLWYAKGLHYLLTAFGQLQGCLGENVSLLLVGDGPEERRLRLRCVEERIANVVFAGFRQRDSLPDLYAATDVFIFPTLGDPYGLVVDEAMAASLPIVTTSAAGEIGERVEDGVNGFVVPPANSAALFERMKTLAEDPSLRGRMGQASAQKIGGHDPDRWAADYERAVERILSVPSVVVRTR